MILFQVVLEEVKLMRVLKVVTSVDLDILGLQHPQSVQVGANDKKLCLLVRYNLNTIMWWDGANEIYF